jgi:hypothetical protein
VVLHGFETWTPTLRKKYRLTIFENGVLRRIFGPRRVEMTRCWRKFYNEEFHNLCYSPNIIRMIKSRTIRWEGYVARMEEKRKAYRLLVGTPERKKSLGRPNMVGG